MDNGESQHRNVVRVKSIKRHNQVQREAEEEVNMENNDVHIKTEEEILDPYTIKRRESMKNNVYDIYVKVMLLGDSGVGKTCMLMRFRDGLFLSGNFISTVGVDFRTKVVEVEQTKVKLQIWDTAGQERFRSVTHAYYRDAHALLLLYDVTNKTSFDNTRAWLGEIHEYAQDDVVIMLLGNKADCGSDRAVRREEGERLAREYNVTFMETSAKSGQNVDLAFHAIAKELKYRQTGQKDPNRFNVQDYVREQTQSSTQCPPCNY
ncbi:ras-related protein Rab-37-like isoform X3 [Cylas formicarius]|uniref:ras-related protein Rab-37-like isoform X3 n=1 Tax=Cylas formicarius TaxID=197179 RepID=UPI002958D671|nr:ras-related protein Rab-37-like isoform X3 [Cylas formicarius]XP_060528358.1 ras-related protein Rab-37-like isoform X3 [Cylas formicarius]XP_060528359.1 ras-related protein Rab-37-like isoform X3 [Cylas formicarius]XP_060528360.1 ras-related protein Rab-37-like isoform X3 [Cylas formicarius]XP_060528361.1 ras-related protein Rab-37-like isoform X3 [Cylas formicarius]XP_060528362.1 ras-related protein Rab-37-like isoform X3 [Cylas formicarius]XP_060528363.1 ras-related protein Rab-37-like 